MKTTLSPMRWTLAITLAALAGAVALPAMAQPPQGAMHAAGMRGGPGHGEGMPMHLSERMLDQVSATPEQRSQIKQIMEGARKDLQAQREANRSMRDEALRVFTQPNVDATAVEALRQKRMTQHDQASRRMTQAMVDVSRVLSPEQRKQLADNLQRRGQMMERHFRERRSLDAPKS